MAPSASPPAPGHRRPLALVLGPLLLGLELGGLGQHLGVEGGGGQQLGVGAVGHHLVLVEQHHPVGQGEGREPVGDDQGGPALHLDLQSGVDGLLHLDVDGAGGVVEDQHRRVDEQCAGDGDALALPARQGVAALTDDGVVAVGQVADELVGPGGPGRRHHLLGVADGLP